MVATCAYSALRTALSYGPKFGYLAFLQMLILQQRPDIVDRANRVTPVSPQNMPSSFDFIIIGAGSAGSVIANRLSECEDATVLLIEAGGDEPFVIDAPGLYEALIGTDREWEYRTEPSTTYCLGMKNQQCNWRQGKSLGGDSTHNGMVYVRGNRRDYDHWRDLGNHGWGYDDVLPYFKKSEDMRVPELKDSPYHGTGGYLTVEKFKYVPKVTTYFLEVGRELGYDVVDFNGATQAGFTDSYGTIRDGLRCSTNKAFLRSAAHRKNLFISTHSMVEKILVNETTKTAYGVKFRRDGRKYTVRAKREVILSAGAIRSPQILMLSGIGPKEHLEEVGVPVIHNSPGVGKNLQDHVVITGLVYAIDVPREKPTSYNADSRCSGDGPSSGAEQFLNENDGPLYESPKDSGLAFVYTRYADKYSGYPDLEVGFDGTAENAGGGFFKECQKNSGKSDLLLSIAEQPTEQLTYTATPSLMRPNSRGYIKLRSNDPNEHPIMEANYFGDPHDLEVLIDGAKIIHNFTQTSTMRKLNARPKFESVAECEKFAFASDDYWKCRARHFTNTGFHPSGSCKMGPASDAKAVVDPRLRVYGIKGLRIADASIMPKLVTANINAPVIMIGEKAADLIKEDHNLDCGRRGYRRKGYGRY